jgi:hypothetical protein
MAVCIFVAPSVLRAQSANVAAALYGQGVEAYFAGQLGDAESYFSRAISLDPTDPRAYYFRAMTRLRNGRDDQARMDMQSGADAEARLPNRFAIGKALERVQGSGRLMLEQYRDLARMSHAVKTIQPAPVQTPDTGVLRERRVVPLDELMQPGVPRAVAVPEPAPPKPAPLGEPAGRSPDAENAATPAATTPPAAASKAAMPADDESPFGEEPTSTPPAKTAAPKATPPVPPQPKSTPPAEKPAAADESPFL